MRFLPPLILMLSCESALPSPAEVPGTEVSVSLSTKDDRPDILFVVLDTARADRLGTYGGPNPTSPALSRLAKSGVLFEDVTSVGSWTWPSHASLFTGVPPWIHGAHFASPEDGGMQMGKDPFHASRMREDLPTLAGRLTEADYQTYAISANRLVSADFGLTRGFTHSAYVDTDTQVMQAAQQVISRASDDPLLLFVNLYGAHAPLEIQSVPWLEGRDELTEDGAAPWLRPFLRKEGTRIQLMRSPSPGQRIGAFSYMRGDLKIPEDGLSLLLDVYDGELRAVDFYMGEIIDAWRRERGSDAIVVVTSDHGEMLGEDQLLEHGRSVAHELIEVPLVVSAPGRWPGGQRVERPVQPHSLMQLLLHFAQIETEGGPLQEALDGVDDSGPIQAAAWRDHFWATEAGDRFDQGYRFYRVGDEAIVFGTHSGLEYYRLDSDPDRNQDLYSQFSDRARELKALSESRFPEVEPTGPVEVPSDAIDPLQALGYIESTDDTE